MKTTLLILMLFAGIIVFSQNTTSINEKRLTDTIENPVLENHKINEIYGNFSQILDDTDNFGVGCDSIGDLNNDGVVDIVVTACRDDDGGLDRGAVYILFLKPDGTVLSSQKISSTEGNFTGILDNECVFGVSVSSLGDLNGDGNSDIAVGAEYDNDGGEWHGAIWILFLNSDGTVQSHQKISDTEGGFTGNLSGTTTFGSDIANMGDINGDGIIDLAVGARRDNDGGIRRGAVWILFMSSNGQVQSHQKISMLSGGFNETLDMDDFFGATVCNIGDLNNDGVNDLAVGAYRDDDGVDNSGAVYILFLNEDGTVQSSQKISNESGNMSNSLLMDDFFGCSVAAIGDLDWDGVIDLLVGTSGDDTGGNRKGTVYMLYMNTDGTVKKDVKIAENSNSFTGTLHTEDYFGRSVASIGVVGNSHKFIVGATGDDDSGDNSGSIWIISIKGSVNTNLQECLSQSNINIYPNPSDDIIFVDYDQPAIIELYDSSGRIVLSSTDKSIDISFCESGVYLIKIFTKTKELLGVKKIVFK